jgi:hypothetical protein
MLYFCYMMNFVVFQCNGCDYSSLTQGGLDRHVRIYHDPHDRQFACKHCTYRGLKRRQLLDHERIVHSQDKNKYECVINSSLLLRTLILKNITCSHLYLFQACMSSLQETFQNTSSYETSSSISFRSTFLFLQGL